ncbi:MAG: hypothetical protein PVH61_22630 [Candidatus Aminicenantes bacterium]|jgi:hypothetical protein
MLSRLILVFILKDEDEGNISPGTFILKGWDRLKELKKTAIDSKHAFVAMPFKKELELVYKEAIKPALEETGYKPWRSDFEQFNDKVDDKIVAEIRRSGLLVAELTGNNAGVYFEAGLAKGLGIEVIWTCRADFIEQIHFDTRQYNFIKWKSNNELREKLKNRIEATMPI